MIYGCVLALLVYLLTNPYIVINAVVNRQVLRSNFGNSLAMYQVSHLGEGFVRVCELTVEGATLPVAVLGLLAVLATLLRRRGATGSLLPVLSWTRFRIRHWRASRQWHPGDDPRCDDPRRDRKGACFALLLIPALLFFVQFVLIGTGKPAEYGRFGIFTDTALCIAAACLITAGLHKSRVGITHPIAAVIVISIVVWHGGLYLANFRADAGQENTRWRMAESLDALGSNNPAAFTSMPIKLFRKPAPYSCPPLNFSRWKVMIVADRADLMAGKGVILYPRDDPQVDTLFSLGNPDGNIANAQAFIASQPITAISWANKPFLFRYYRDSDAGQSSFDPIRSPP